MIATAAFLLALGYEGAHKEETKTEGALLTLAIFMSFDLYMATIIAG